MRFLVVALVALAAQACSMKVMHSSHVRGGRSVKMAFERATDKEGIEQLVARICDVDAKGLQNCRESKVLENVVGGLPVEDR